MPGVLRVHDLHVWSMDASEPALTAHLVLRCRTGAADELLHAATRELRQRFAIEHATLQLESEAFANSCQTDASACAVSHDV